jgi:hypothetical protein
MTVYTLSFICSTHPCYQVRICWMADPGSLPLQVRLHHVDVRVPLLPHQRGRHVRHIQLLSHRCKFIGIVSRDEYFFEGF